MRGEEHVQQAKSARTGEKPPREAPPAWAEKLKAGLQWMAELDAARPTPPARRRPAVKAAAGPPPGAAPPRGCAPDRSPDLAAPTREPSPATSPEVAAPDWTWDDIPPIDLSAFEPLEPPGPTAADGDLEVLEDGFELIEEPVASRRPRHR